MANLTKLDRASEIAIKTCMNVKKNEKVLVITDEQKREIGISLHENAKRLGFNSLLVDAANASASVSAFIRILLDVSMLKNRNGILPYLAN